MSFIQRELDQIGVALRKTQEVGAYDRLYAAQQALSWALDPSGFKAPYAAIMGTLEGLEDCSAHIHHDHYE